MHPLDESLVGPHERICVSVFAHGAALQEHLSVELQPTQ